MYIRLYMRNRHPHEQPNAMKPKPPAKRSAKSASDLRLAKVAKRGDAQINEAVANDPDTFLPTVRQLVAARRIAPLPKRSIALRVDPEIIAYFQQAGRGYQTRMVGVLREFVRLSKQRA